MCRLIAYSALSSSDKRMSLHCAPVICPDDLQIDTQNTVHQEPFAKLARFVLF